MNAGLNAKHIAEKLKQQYTNITIDIVKNSLKRKLTQYVEFKGTKKFWEDIILSEKNIIITLLLLSIALTSCVSKTYNQFYSENTLLDYGLTCTIPKRMSEKIGLKGEINYYLNLDDNALFDFYNKSVGCIRLVMNEYDKNSLLTTLGLLKNNKLLNAGYVLFSEASDSICKNIHYQVEIGKQKRIDEMIKYMK